MKNYNITPVLKHGKDPCQPTNYRPISLTSVLGKLYEKILNKRLVWYLESNNLLNQHQYGFRKNRSTIHALLDLQMNIHKAFVNRGHLYTVFFDLEKAYDLTWRYNILRTLHNMGIRGPLPYSIFSFLTNRVIQVQIGTELSSPKIIENGFPQGSVLSVTLFLIAVNNIHSRIPFPIKYRMFADDLSISLESNNVRHAGRVLQIAINSVQK